MLPQISNTVNGRLASSASLPAPVPCHLPDIIGQIRAIKTAPLFICPHCWQPCVEPAFFRIHPAGRRLVYVYALCALCTYFQNGGALILDRIDAFFGGAE